MDRVVGVLFAVLAVPVVLAGLRDAVRVRRLRQHGIRTLGYVVDQVEEKDESGSISVPVIAFTDQRGCRVEFQPGMRGAGMRLPTGREVPVVYLADNPQAARVEMWRHMTGSVLFVLLLGSVLLFSSLGLVLQTS